MSETINKTVAGIFPLCFNSNISVIKLEAVSDRGIVWKCVCKSYCRKYKKYFRFDSRTLGKIRGILNHFIE